MKATVKFKDNGAYKQKTFEVEKSEPNAIVKNSLK